VTYTVDLQALIEHDDSARILATVGGVHEQPRRILWAQRAKREGCPLNWVALMCYEGERRLFAQSAIFLRLRDGGVNVRGLAYIRLARRRRSTPIDPGKPIIQRLNC